METRDNLLEKFNTAQTELAFLLEAIVNEKNEMKALKDKLDERLKKSNFKVKVLRKQIEFYKSAHSKLKNIFLSGLEVFRKVDFRSRVSIEYHKFSLEVLQKHFLEYTNNVSSISEIPTEHQVERSILQKNSTERTRSVVSSSESEDGNPDDTNLEFVIAWNPDGSGGLTENEVLRDSGLESVKEEFGVNEFDFSDIQFDDDFSINTEFAADETNEGRSEIANGGNTAVTQNIAVPSTSGSNMENEFLVDVKPEVMIVDEYIPNPAGSQNRQGRNIPERLHERNFQSNEPARGIYNSTVSDERPLQQTSKPVMINYSREVNDSCVVETGFGNSSLQKHYQGEVTRPETFKSEPQCDTPVTASTNNMTGTIKYQKSRSPVFKDQRHPGKLIEDSSKQLNENLASTSYQGCGKASLRNYKRPRQEEGSVLPSGMGELRPTGNQEQGMRSDREDDELSDQNVYCNTTEEEDDIILDSPGKVIRVSFNTSVQKVPEEPRWQLQHPPKPVSDLDETFVSPSAVRKYEMDVTRSSQCDSVPFSHQREPVRKRAERMKLPGQACADCNKYYNDVYGGASTSDYNRILNKCSRHRNAGDQNDTPPGYWTPFLTGNEE